MIDRPVIIVNYNNTWPEMFEKLKLIIQEYLGELVLSIEHVGSTSIPGLAAKPIIDIDVVVESFSQLPTVIDKLSELGYVYEGNLGIEDREAFARKDNFVPYSKDNNEKPEHHLYVCNVESRELLRHIKFRDTLNTHPSLVTEYGQLKKELAEAYRNNRKAYTEGKTQFVTKVLNDY